MFNLFKMPKKRYDHCILEEPLIDINLEPTEDVDPLFIDPTSETISNEIEDETALSGFSIFSPKVGDKKDKKKLSITDKEIVKVKDENSDNASVTVKEEPIDTDDDFDFTSKSDEEPEVDPVEALAQALDEVEHLCPRCTFRSKEKEKVSQHIVSSHRIFQVGIPRPCDKCDFIAKTVRELTSHKKLSHPRTYVQYNLPTLPTGEYKCPHCDFSSFHRNNIRSHMRVHTQDTVYTCDKCPYTATSRLNIENHAAKHLIKRKKKWKFKCKHCGLLERTKTLLQRHLILHGEGEMLKCQLCSYKSPYNHIISMHTRICHGIICKKSWDKEEKWKMRVRKSTRRCARKKASIGDESNEDTNKDDVREEFLELPRRTRKPIKKVCDNAENEETEGVKVDDKSEDSTNDSVHEKTKEENPSQRRPTLEERLGRARDLINKNFAKKKNKTVKEIDGEGVDKKNKNSISAGENHDQIEKTIESDEEGMSHENSAIQSEEDDTVSKDEDTHEEDSEFYPETAEDSMQSFASDKTLSDSMCNASSKENDTSAADPHNKSLINNKERKRNGRYKKKCSGPSSNVETGPNKTAQVENEAKRIKIDNSIDEQQAAPSDSVTAQAIDREIDQVELDQPSPTALTLKNANEDDQDDSVPAVLVFKRNGSSFTCIQKNSNDDTS